MFAGVGRPLSIQGSGWGIQLRRSDFALAVQGCFCVFL